VPSAVRHARDASSEGGWSAATALPCAALTGIVHGYSGFQEVSRGPVERRELPSSHLFVVINTETALAVRRGTTCVITPTAFVVGPGLGAVTTLHPGRHRALELRLPATASAMVLGVPAGELRDQVVDLQDLWAGQAVHLSEALVGLTWQASFHLLEAVLLQRIALPAPLPDPALQRARDLLLSHEGDVGMARLLTETGWSRGRLAQQFREHTGMTPKALARLLRFRHAERLLRTPARRSLADIAATCGYYDQAHLNRDFRELAGCSPMVHLSRMLGDDSGTAMAAAAT
jgi:AraC-like DNA-binding protein